MKQMLEMYHCEMLNSLTDASCVEQSSYTSPEHRQACVSHLYFHMEQKQCCQLFSHNKEHVNYMWHYKTLTVICWTEIDDILLIIICVIYRLTQQKALHFSIEIEGHDH